MTFAWGFVAGFFIWPVSYSIYEIIESFRESNPYHPADL